MSTGTLVRSWFDAAWKLLNKAFNWTLTGIGIALILYLIGLLIYAPFVFYKSLDESGYFEHTRTVDFYMTGDWLVGENRGCDMATAWDKDYNPTGKIFSVTCPMDDRKLELHNMQVSFYGDISPTDGNGKPRNLPEQWTCTRHSDGFSCKVAPKAAK